jgi:hypothetical protein
VGDDRGLRALRSPIRQEIPDGVALAAVKALCLLS